MDDQSCIRLFGEKRAAEMQAFVERTLDADCPCKRGKPCPLVGGTMLAATSALSLMTA